MEVSTFELLYKPLTPSLGTGTEAIARRVLQGYFLTVANLEDVPFTFRIAFEITLPSPDDPARRLDDNALFISDVAAPDNVFKVGLTRSPAGGNRYFTTFKVPAKSTALVVLLPNLLAPDFFGGGTPAKVEIRGVVRLTLPLVFTSPFIFVPQKGAPARVLLTAEHRSTYLPIGWPAAGLGDLDFDQTGVALPLASGKALNEVPSEVLRAVSTAARISPEALVGAVDPLEDVDPMVAIASGLARLDPRTDAVAMLRELGLPLELEKVSGRKESEPA